MKDRFSVKSGGIFASFANFELLPDNLGNNHCHDFYEILFVIHGSGRYVVEGTEFVVRPRTLMVFRPLAYHYLSLEPEVAYERFLIHFPKNAVPAPALALLEKICGEGDGSGNYYPPSAISDSLNSAFDRFEIAARLPDEEKQAYIKVLLAEIIILLSASAGEQMLHTEEELGARVIRYLNSHIEHNINLDKLAKRFFVSKYYLCRAFKKHNGISIHGYLVQKRIAYAKQLIESGETASGAAYKVGFGDYSAFYRAYVKIVGKSPTSD